MKSTMPCPCGTFRPPMLWRKGKSHRYVLRCPTCRRQSHIATTDHGELEKHWNDTVQRDLHDGYR